MGFNVLREGGKAPSPYQFKPTPSPATHSVARSIPAPGWDPPQVASTLDFALYGLPIL